MSSPRPFALLRTEDQWRRASHEATALLGETVRLDWEPDSTASGGNVSFTERGAGLAFDPHCRLYHSIPSKGRIERLRWAAQDPLQPVTGTPAPTDLFASEMASNRGDFVLADVASSPLREPRGLAVDSDERLYVAETGNHRILVYDLWSHRLLREIALSSAPVDLAAHHRSVYALCISPPVLLQFDARSEVEVLPWPADIEDPCRIALSATAEIFILDAAGTADAAIWHGDGKEPLILLRFPTDDPSVSVDQIPFATDIEFQPGSAVLEEAASVDTPVLVVARRPGEDFRRFSLKSDVVSEFPPLKARGYDGLGIVCTPDGRIGFWTQPQPGGAAAGTFRHAVAARLKYRSRGAIITFRLDSGEFQNVWGRIFLDACIPRDTQIQLKCVATDEPPEAPPIPYQPPANSQPPPHLELSPPLPPEPLAERLLHSPPQNIHRRETGRELPWVRPVSTDRFETYEAPVLSDPGRYLWVRIELNGNTRTTPRIRALRAEHASHDYLRRLPKTFSRDDEVASFLRRYLAMFEGVLGELEAKADARGTLLNPRSAPAEILPWLAGFLGLALDERLARAPRPHGRLEDVRRTLIQEVAWLFRFRGTAGGLLRFLEIYVGVRPILIEKFRVRGLGGAILGDPTGLTSSSVLGAGFRIGGAIGESETQVLTGSIEDAFATHAHRFTVVIPASLAVEPLAVVQYILDVHRPAHTLVDVCTVGSGMRVGRGLHVELTSIIGRTGGFYPVRVAGSFLGRSDIVGRPEAGVLPGSSRVRRDTHIG